MNLRISIYVGLVGYCVAIFSATEGFAQHCQPYWTAQYKCAVGCGPCGGGGGNVTPQPYVAAQPSAAEIAAQRAHVLNEAGNNAYNAKNWTLAISLYAQALQLTPNDTRIANNLRGAHAAQINGEGMKAARAHNWALAVKLFEQAVRTGAANELSKRTMENNLKLARAALDEQKRQRQQNALTRPVATAQSTPAKNISNEWVCPPDLPQVASNPARFNQPDGHYCIAKNSIACGSPSKSWACEAGHTCNGDGSDPKVVLCR